MSVWLHQHYAAFVLALRRLALAPINTLLSLLAIGIALALPLGGFMVFANLQQLAIGSGATPQLSVFMQLNAQREDAEAIDAKLSEHHAVKAAEFLARENTRTSMGEAEGLSDVIDALPKNPFPDAFVITPVDTRAEAMESLADEIRTWPKVEHVQIDSTWVRRLNAMLQLGRTGLAILSLLLGFGLIAITFNTIRLQILTLRREIEVSQLLGATTAFISRPFYYTGVLQGLLGALVAWLLVAAATFALRPPAKELMALYGLGGTVNLPDALLLAAFLAAAGALGWLGTLLSLSQYLRSSTMR